MMPEPGHVVALTAAGNADDLIAKMAEAQIDQMLSEADVSSPELEPNEPAIVPDLETNVPAATDVVDASSADLIKDVDHVADAVAAVSAALDAVDAPNVTPVEMSVAADAISPSAAAVATDPTTEIAVELPASTSHAIDSADAVAAELAEDALLHGRPVEPPPSTRVEPTHVASSPVEPAHIEPALVESAHVEPPAKEATHVAEAAHAAHASPGEHSPAVAAAATTANHAEHASSIPEVPASSPHDAKVSTWKTMLREVPWFMLDAINAPVRSLSDRQREALGGIAIVTIVNAAGLLIYRIFFAKH